CDLDPVRLDPEGVDNRAENDDKERGRDRTLPPRDCSQRARQSGRDGDGPSTTVGWGCEARAGCAPLLRGAVESTTLAGDALLIPEFFRTPSALSAFAVGIPVASSRLRVWKAD